MTHWLQAHLDELFHQYGYWTVFVGLLLENAGVPLPGETILILATILAVTQHELNVFTIGLVAFVAAVSGDNIGFTVGRFGGCPLLKRYSKTFHIKDELIRKGEDLFARHGKVAVFLARFIAGLRMLAGPLAGVLGMRWIPFAIFNALGAVCWVAAIVSLAYFLGPSVEKLIGHASWAILAIVGLGLVYWFFKERVKKSAPHT